METKQTNTSITNLFGSIAAAQTMVEQFPFSFGVNENGFTCTFDLLSAIFKLISSEPIEEKIISFISEKLSDENNTWLQNIEDAVKMALELNLTNMVTCDMSPLIPDNLISCGEFLKDGNNGMEFQGEGIIIPCSAIDFTGFFNNCPVDENNLSSEMQYLQCSHANGANLTVEELWQHDDFNAFLWYVKHKGVYNNVVERKKLIWDNRYKTKPFTKYQRKPDGFFTMEKGVDSDFDIKGQQSGIFPFSETYLESYNKKNSYKKRQILECRYIDGEGIHSDSFQFRLPASNYYKTRKLTGDNNESPILKLNKTIFEFNHDFLMSVKLFDAKTFLCQFVNGLLGSHNLSINLSLNKEEIYTNAIVDSIIEKVINVSDIETNDCYFTFSNEEYDEMLQNAIEQRINGQSNYYLLETMIGEINTLKNINTDEKKQTITNVLNNVKNATQNGEGTKNSWKLNYDYQFELIRMLCYPLVKPLFSPKVMVLILINLYVMGNPLKLSNSLKNNNKNIVFDDIKPYIMGALTNIIVQIKDIINEILFSWVIEELTPLLSLFSLRLLMEQIEMYRLLLQDMLSACIGFKGNKNNVGIGNVEYVDIYPELEDMKKTVNSIINC